MTPTDSWARRARSGRGQAVTELVLMTWGLVMILCIILQVFLIDQYSFEIAVRAHSRLFTQTAYPDNKPDVKYETRWTSKFEGPHEYVPVVGFFQLYGVTRDDLRIRTIHGRPGGYKRIKLGRGTKADVATGLEGLADYASLWTQVINGMSQLDDAKRKAQEMPVPAAKK
ncbi:MAG: hypothetical protein NTY02_15925 [Acidobacteria bacterium]|nr:hypothetical protein [Acidobacteriota bacterium]